MVGDVRDLMTCAEFQIEIFMGYDFTLGRIFDFLIDFIAWALQQCSATALPVILTMNGSNYVLPPKEVPFGGQDDG